MELFGEGLFISLPPESGKLQPRGERTSLWKYSADATKVDFFQYGHLPPPLEDEMTNPLFVWWHTLSHRLINALSLDSGYSSASIRERIYISKDGKEGGILLYTTQPGGDGTYGGLISQANRFDRIIQRAVVDVDRCSNDPVCKESKPSESKLNGAACYSCLLASETSCEVRNFLLDRNVLIENL